MLQKIFITKQRNVNGIFMSIDRFSLIKKTISGISLLFLSNSLWAIDCYYTLVKDNCWNKYNVTVDVIDATTSKVLTTIEVPSGQSWMRQNFQCNPGETLTYRAHFSPEIWKSDKDKTYNAKNYWSLPSSVKAGDSAWNITVCYSADFAQIPLPPDATGSCQCNLKEIPEIPPKKI